MKIITAPRHGSLKVRLGFAAAFFAAFLSSCDQAPLSKETIRKSLMERAERNKQPLMIDSISDVQTMTLHGEKCSTAMAYVKGPLGLSMPIYFVCKQGNQDYISGGGDLIKEIDEKGYDTVLAQLPKENSDSSSPAPTLSATAEAQTPAIQAPTVASTPDVRKALADDDASDLSHCSDDDITVIAELAAKSYLKKHLRIYTEEQDRDLSIRLGMQHGLLGDSLFHYRREWLETITALSKTSPEETPKPSSTSTPKPTLTVTPTPTVEATPEPTATEPPKPSRVFTAPTPNSTESYLRESGSLSEHTQEMVKTFAENFVLAGEANDPSVRNQFYAPVVDQFYEHRHFTRQEIIDSDRAYCRKWPIRHFRPDVETFRVADLGSDFEVTGLFSWSVSNGSRTLRGSSLIRVRIEATSENDLQIIDVDEQIQK
jgi:hypothetical protein